jgi:hypothetical protein
MMSGVLFREGPKLIAEGTWVGAVVWLLWVSSWAGDV